MSRTIAHESVKTTDPASTLESAADRLEGLLGSTDILLSAAYEQGWNECLAYVLRGDLRPRRPRPARSGAGPDLRVVTDESVRLILEASGQ